MSLQRLLLFTDRLSIWAGKAAAWLIILLMVVICGEVAKRYAFNAPTDWIFDFGNMAYGTLFMLGGAYTLSQNGHVRGDFFYANMPPRRQAFFDLLLYFILFIPGILALCYAGYDYAADAWRIQEHSNATANGPPVYHFKTIIPIAGALMMAQGIAEIVRCAVCLKTGSWPARIADAEEIDVIEEQLANSEYIDAETKTMAIERAHNIDEAAKQRGMSEGGRA